MPEQTPNEPHKSYDELIAEVLKEHASPEKEEAALQERIERDAQVLRDFLNPTQEQPQQEQGNRYQCAPEQQQQEQQSQEPQPEPKQPTVHRVSIEGRDYEVRVDANDITNAAKIDQPRPNNCAQRVRDAFGISYFMDGPQRSQRTPFLRTHWLIEFEKYLAQRWYDSTHPLPGYFQGPNAKNPALAPLVQIAQARGVFDLHDPLTATVWEDYLNEHPIRRQLWEKYQRENGHTRALYWRNAQGEAWEAVHGATHKEAA